MTRTVARPVGDVRLTASLEVLRIALATYLSQLRDLWSSGSDPASSGEIERLLAAAGTRPVVVERERRQVAALLEGFGKGPQDADGRDGGRSRLGAMATALGLSVGDELLVGAVWWAETDPQFATVLGCAHDDGSRRYASAGLLHLVLQPYGVDVVPSLDDEHPLVSFGVVEPGAGPGGALRLTATARLLLHGGLPVRLSADYPLPARLAGDVDGLARYLADGGVGMVALRGPEGSGRQALAIAAALDAGLLPVAADRPGAELRLLASVGAAVAVTDTASAVALGWQSRHGPLLVLAAPDDELPASAQPIDVRPPDHDERAAHWEHALAAVAFGTRSSRRAMAATLAERFAFTEGDIDATVARAVTDSTRHETAIDDELLWASARRQPQHALARLANLISPVFTLDDLVVTDATRAQLEELIAHVAMQHLVLDEWGFRQRLPRGQGVAALFAGPSGTGKTMAAEALANTLHQDLYRIDLSAVVSKYIGETEKNLGAVFDEAERAGAVLFFDEADALFGKRTEVKDAHDRYANIEVNYLLQRVESFTGLVLLASNKRAAIDEAFLRRLRFVIRFDPPDAALREQLWQRSFPAQLGVSGLDWGVLSAAELAGGNIQSVALHAAYRAAADGGIITPAHVQAALQREYDKLGKAWPGFDATPGGRS